MELEGLVAKFNGEDADQNPDTLLEYAQQIHNFFAGKLDPTKLDYYFGLAFPKSEGLLKFLERQITRKPLDKVKEAVFNLIQYVLVQKAWRSDADRFYIGFKETANMYWKHSKESARLQQAALDCLILLFDSFGSTLDLYEFEAKDLYLDLLKNSEKSIYQPTVRGKMFHLMGILGYLGHDTYMRQNGWFLQLFKHVTSTVRTQVESSHAKVEASILHGCIKGLDRLLKVFDSEINVGDSAWVGFQEQLQKIVDPALSIVKGEKNVIKRREFQRAALELVANHGQLLQVGLFKKYRQWFEDLVLWAKSANADDNRIGRRAMYKFLEIIIVDYPNQFKSNADDKQRSELESFFKYFAEKFKSVLNTKNANRIELLIAVRGFGMLSNLCTEHKQACDMLDLIMIHVDNIIHELDSPVVDKYSGSISALPTYLESVASILPSLKTENNANGITEQYLESIKKLTILLIRFYPDFSESQRQYAHISVHKVFDSFWNDHHLLCEPFIEQVYQQSLLHIVSCPTKVEIDILIESWNRSHPESKKSALSQLGLKPVKSYVHFWKQLLSRGEAHSQELQFDLLMQWMVATMGKLDLTITFDDSESSEINLDPVQGATASVVKDFQIFVNIVDLYQDIMLGEHVLYQKFEKWVVPFSYEILEYIKRNVFVSGFYKILSVVFDAARSLRFFEETTNLEARNLHERLNIFFQGLGTKIQEFRDDLLFSVLELWLSLPDSLILTNFAALNQTLKTVFITGKSSFSLAIKGLEAVERWCFQKDFPVEEITAIMNNIFPILKTFFVTSENLLLDENAVVEDMTRKGNLKTLIKRNVQTKKHVDGATLKATQLKILHLIGSFGQFIQLEQKEHQGLTKDQRFLLYDIPFQDCKPGLFIDDLLPRVMELALNSVERQTRVSACEFFHTVCLVFIGKSRDPQSIKENLFRRIFHSALKLGCDSDIVVRQLFNPLCLQMIHWFTKRNSPYILSMMDVLTDNLTQSEDLNRREFAALCFGEYFLWSLKHQDGYDTGTKGKGVMKSIFAMSTHASPTYRQGSVLAFNSIYRDFREDLSLTSEFSFNLLFSFLTSLKLSKNLPEDCLLITSTKQAIKHLERIFTKKKDRFNTALRRHFKPATTEKPCLRDVVNWLVGEGGDDAKIYREECLRLVEALCPLTKDVVTVEKCLTMIEEEHGVDVWIQIAEGKVKLNMSNEESVGQIEFLDTASTFYEFLNKQSMLSKKIFVRESRSKFCATLMAICTSSQASSPIPYSEEQNLQLLNIFSRLRFAWGVLDNESLTKLWVYSMKLSKEIASFDSLEVMGYLIKVWCSGTLTPSTKLQFSHMLLFEPIEDVNSVNDDKLISIVKESVWHRDMAEGGVTSLVVSEECLQQLRYKLWNSVSCALFKQSNTSSSDGLGWQANNLSLNRKKITENYLVTALCLNIDEDVIVDAVFDPSDVSCKDGTYNLVETKGNVFQKQLMNAVVYCKKLFQFDVLLQEKPIKEVGDFIHRLLNLIKSNRVLRKMFGESVFRQTLANWKMISINCDASTCVKIFVGLLAVNIDACRNSDELVSWWCGSKLMQARHLDLKQKAEVFGYATIFAASRKKKTIDLIIKTIGYVVDNVFRPEQKWEDVEQYVTHIFRKSLKVFEQLPRSLEVLEPILWTLAKVSQWMDNKIDHSVFLMARDSVEKAVQSLCETDNDRVNLVSNIYQIITSVEPENKLLTETPAVWKSFLLPAVSVMNVSPLKNFFKKHIYNIIQKMELNPESVYAWMAKTLSVHLLELLVYQTNADFIKGKELSDAYLRNASPQEIVDFNKKPDDKVKIVYSSIIRVCVQGIDKSKDLPTEDLLLRRSVINCHEASYNTLVATLLVTKGDYKFFNRFLFCGKKWYEKIIDVNVVYEFPMFIDEASHKSGVIRPSRRKTKSLVPVDPMDLLPASGNLTGSSLAPEATSYDFTTSVTVANSDFYRKIFAETTSDGAQGLAKDNEVQVRGDKLEWNEINKHGCMFAYVEALKQMAEFHQTKQDTSGREWVSNLRKMLTDPSVHKSIKTFLVGGIVNTPESVEPFAAELIEPIIQLILGDCFGVVKLNHFVQDVIITSLSWIKTPGAIPDDESVKNILNYIVEGLKTEEISKRKDVLNHVLEILQNVVRYWAEGDEKAVLIPAKEIYQLGPPNPTDDSSSLRLNVCLNVLIGGQLPNPNVTEFVRFLSKSTISKYKAVHVTAAKCIGQLLRMVKEKAPDYLEEHINTVGIKLTSSSKTKPSVFVENLSAIQLYFPEMVTRVKNTIMELFQFPKVRSDLLTLLPLLIKQLATVARDQTFVIDMSPSSPNFADEFFTDIDGRGLFNHPCKTANDLQSGLDLFSILIDNCAQPSQLLRVVDWVSLAETSDSNKIKTQFADCLTMLHDRLLTEAVQLERPIDPSIKQSFLKIFFRMYENDDEQVHEVVSRFWINVLREWGQSADLMLELLDLIGHEEHPLNVFLGLILQRCSLAPDHSKHIFPEPLHDCDFVPFQLDTSWRLQHSTFQPLFAESLSSVKNFGTLPRTIQSSLFSQRRSVGKFGMNVLRATLANLQFTPTQQEAPGNSMDEYMMDVDQANFQFDDYNTRHKVASNSGDIPANQEGLNNSPCDTLGSTILKLRKKFYVQKDSTFYATRGSEVRSERKEEARDLVKARISGVKTVRSYRIGELPDILIRHSDLLNTLLKLAKQDENFGRQFLILLFQGMIAEMQSDQRRNRRFLSKAKDIFDRVFRNTLVSPDRSLSTLLMELSIINSIPVPTNAVLDICKCCDLQALGILKLEQELLDEVDFIHDSSKRARPASQSERGENAWMGLAELYKEIEEYDVLRNIFEKIECSTTNDLRKRMYVQIGEALHMEGMGYLEKAVELLDNVIDGITEEDISTTGKMFLEDSLMNCVAELSDWDALYQLTARFNSFDTDDFFGNREIVERLLPMQMLSGMQLSLRNESDDDPDENLIEFNDFMEKNLATEEGTNFLTSVYPFDVGVWLLIENEAEFAPQAKLMLEKGHESIIRRLKNVESLPIRIQRTIILSLQQSVVLHDYLKWSKHGLKLSALQHHTQQLLRNWTKPLTHQPLDLKGNSLMTAYRDCFLAKIGVTLQDIGAGDKVLLSVQELRVDQDIWLANLGAFHKSFPISQNGLSRLKSTGRDDIRPVEFRKSLAKSLSVFAKMLEPKDWCKRWCSIWKKLDKINQDGDLNLIKVDLLHCLTDNVRAGTLEDSSRTIISKALGVADSKSTLATTLLNTVLSLIPSGGVDVSEQSPSLFNKLFCLLKKLTEVDNTNNDTAETMLTCILRGCTEQGSANEMLLLSNIFPMLKQFPSLNQPFQHQVSSVPSFLFLPWIDQIITAYKSLPVQYPCFKHLIEKLVKDFPQAFQLQYPEYLDANNSELFGKSLKALVLPYKMHENITANITNERNSDKRVSLLYEFQGNLQEIINNSNTFYGEYHTEYANEMFDIVNRALAEISNSSQSSESHSSQSDSLNYSWSKYRDEIQKTQDIHTLKVQRLNNKILNLERLSPFLANFHFFEHASFEKPGLYENFKKPNVQEHPIIVSFHPTVTYFNSLTRPIRFTVITNDGKRSNFLSKLGDDLRQDRRIQQLFKMSNVLFEKDVALKKRCLTLGTYSCIPISPDFGIIEMIDNVMSLVDVMFDSQDLRKRRGEMIKNYEARIKSSCSADSKVLQGYDHYRIFAKIVGREQAEQFYSQFTQALPKYLLSDHIKKRSSNLQEYFSVRQSLVKSYGALCMVHWLLGIGDRHLENCLLSMNTGNLVGIDFGRAFGTCNYVIPIPEMVPFRLTPQLQQLMMPHGYKGLFRESCILTWNCLVDASEVILTVASVFIQEPTLDWLKFRQGSRSGHEEKEQETGTEMEVTSTQDFFPFEILKRKLLSHNPTHLVLDELKMHNRKDVAAICCKVVEDGRIFKEKAVLPSEEYIDVLLHLATDKNILSRIFSGWNSWI